MTIQRSAKRWLMASVLALAPGLPYAGHQPPLVSVCVSKASSSSVIFRFDGVRLVSSGTEFTARDAGVFVSGGATAIADTPHGDHVVFVAPGGTYKRFQYLRRVPSGGGRLFLAGTASSKASLVLNTFLPEDPVNADMIAIGGNADHVTLDCSRATKTEGSVQYFAGNQPRCGVMSRRVLPVAHSFKQCSATSGDARTLVWSMPKTNVSRIGDTIEYRLITNSAYELHGVDFYEWKIFRVDSASGERVMVHREVDVRRGSVVLPPQSGFRYEVQVEFEFVPFRDLIYSSGIALTVPNRVNVKTIN